MSRATSRMRHCRKPDRSPIQIPAVLHASPMPKPIRKSERKLFNVLHINTLAGETLTLSPCTPHALALSGDRPHSRAKQTVSPVKHSRETSLSLHPSILSGRPWGFRAPWNPLAPFGRLHHQSGENSDLPRCPHRLGSILRPQDPRPFHGDQERSISLWPFLGTFPSTKGRVTPLGTPANQTLLGAYDFVDR